MDHIQRILTGLAAAFVAEFVSLWPTQDASIAI